MEFTREKQKNEIKYKKCVKCGEIIRYTDSDTWWDYSGSGYDTKLVKCMHCNTPNILKYEDADWLKNGF